MSERPVESTPGLSRRALGCAALFGVTGPLLVACGSDDPEPGAASPTSPGTSSDGGSGTGSGSGSDGGGLVAAADVPVGGGVAIPAENIVVTQPTEGEFKAFSSVCTHQGAQLTGVGGGLITCPRHGSQFAVEDGANVTGPNGSAGGSVADLPVIAVKVEGGQVVRA